MFKLIKELSDQFKKSLKDELLGTADKKHKQAKTKKKNYRQVSQEFAKSSDILAYRTKGVWFFDKKHSELKYRLLGLMPVGKNLKIYGAKGGTGYFWLWYPQVREILSKHKVFNDKNNNNRISFDDLLENRRFSSFIYKYNNVYGDREIKDYITKRDGEDYYQNHLRILLESERIKKQILDFEVDMWGY